MNKNYILIQPIILTMKEFVHTKCMSSFPAIKKKKKHKQGNSSRMENRFQLNINRGIVQEWKIASS